MSAPRLTLAIRNVDALDNGQPTRLQLDQRGAVIGRSATADWSLPDPRSYVSSHHCEIAYRDNGYSLTDTSTNGTFVNGSTTRISNPYAIADGDVIHVGHYEILVSLQGVVSATVPDAPSPPAWGGWQAPPAPPPEPAGLSGWDSPSPEPGRAVPPSQSGWEAPSAPSSPSGGWGAPAAVPPVAAPAVAPAGHSWGSPSPAWSRAPANSPPWDSPVVPAEVSSPWSSAVTESAPPSADDIWGKMTQGNVVDWARGGFGANAAPASPPPAAPMAAAFVPPSLVPPRQPEPRTSIPQTASVQTVSTAANAMARFLAEAGLERSDVKGSEDELFGQAGGLIRRLVAGLVVMMEARARAKSQMGAQSTIFSREGNNPLKFARTPHEAIVHLLNPPISGFMGTDRAIEDSFRDLQAHQMATLKAMQGALRATLDRFSPTAIRKRAETGGFLSRILPGARDAALWQAYEKEFSGVTKGSEEAFLDTFAKEFRKAYEEAARG